MANYNCNSGYKNITAGNAASVLSTINSNLSSIKNGSYTISSRKSYCVESHYQPFDYNKYSKAKQNTNFRLEEWMCKLAMGKNMPIVGDIVDYQVPLKHSRKDCPGMGKIDLLAVNGDTAYLLELKVPESTEHPLRAIMEIYTYWQQLGARDNDDFINNSMAKGATKLKKAIVIFEKDHHTSSKYLYNKLKKDETRLRILMKNLEVDCFIAELDPINSDLIIGLKKWK